MNLKLNQIYMTTEVFTIIKSIIKNTIVFLMLD